MISSKLLQGLSIARTGVYFLEGLPLIAFQRFHKPEIPPPTREQVRYLWKQVLALHERDTANVERGIYSWRALEFESPIHHIRTFAEVLRDGVQIARRMRKNQSKDIAQEHKDNAPEYYARNFHFQTDGYFSEGSARLYDHQVEILFKGTAGAMRRLILPPMHEALGSKPRILEIGCGTGSATRLVALSFPKSRITALDLSAPYLKVAQDNLRSYPNVDFSQGDGTALEFKDQMFDCVFSVFLFHELPAEERKKVVAEAWRVLKPGGLLVLADSLQWDDDPNLNWALESFPKIYHEPFYTNYLKSSLEKLAGHNAKSDHALFTKVVWATKPQ